MNQYHHHHHHQTFPEKYTNLAPGQPSEYLLFKHVAIASKAARLQKFQKKTKADNLKTFALENRASNFLVMGGFRLNHGAKSESTKCTSEAISSKPSFCLCFSNLIRLNISGSSSDKASFPVHTFRLPCWNSGVTTFLAMIPLFDTYIWQRSRIYAL